MTLPQVTMIYKSNLNSQGTNKEKGEHVIEKGSELLRS